MSHASKTRKKLRGKRGSGGGGGGGGRGQRRSAAATVAEAAAAAAAAKTAMQGCFGLVALAEPSGGGGGSRKETTKPCHGPRSMPRVMSVQGVRSLHGRAPGREAGPAGQQNERQGGEGLGEGTGPGGPGRDSGTRMQAGGGEYQ